AVDNQVWEALKRELKHPQRIIADLEKNAAKREAERQPDREYMQRLQREVAALDARWERARKSYNDGVTTIDDLKKDRAQIDYDRQMWQDKIAELQERLSSAVHDKQTQAAFLHTVERIRRGIDVFDAAEKRRAIEALDIRLTLHRGTP